MWTGYSHLLANIVCYSILSKHIIRNYLYVICSDWYEILEQTSLLLLKYSNLLDLKFTLQYLDDAEF